MRLHRENIRRAKAQLELNLDTAVKEKKKVFTNMSVTKGQDSNIRAAKKGLNVRIGFLIL